MNVLNFFEKRIAGSQQEGRGRRSPRSSFVAGALCLLASFVLVGCAGVHPVPEAFQEVPLLEEEYVIGVSDQLRITVWKNPELMVEAVPVRPDGRISVPLVNDVEAAGLTPEELKEVVTERLSEYIATPVVTVVVMGANSRAVTILGGVVRTGKIGINQRTRLTEAISSAGGFTPFANKKRVSVLRLRPDGEMDQFVFNTVAFIKGKAPGTNVYLRPGDTIVVPD